MTSNKKPIVIAIIGVVLFSILALALGLGPERGARQEGPATRGGGSNDVVVVRIEGLISGSGGSGGILATGGPRIIDTLRQISEDPTVKAVVLRINSPGGTAAASQEIAQEVDRLRQKGKVVVTSMGDTAASGGYWIAARTDKIVANPATTTGSIGVIIDLVNLEELYDKIGYRSETIKSGPHKDITSPSRERTVEERQLLQEMVDDIYEQFVYVVAEGRNLPEEEVRKLADGRIFTGRQAQQVGLVDELGNFYDAVEIAADLAGIDSPNVREYGRVSPWGMLFQSTLGGLSGNGNLSMEDLARYLRTLETTEPLIR
ncbi:signal peptide peptidase SppA [Heliorestis acidaminivorans]|uniref:Signal peptide peptidase SppA n=1 Tax=Heliorestis acidaminivorans TaxID=553427 RepID=A0A6I0EW47_9FIRM|nr:signal peptide peptidase SppA [Heliorestis acidaminivorans]KAB2953829.1 signal peptide peptidase SppA [Heliorestis acidaminivorans]